MTSAPEKLDDRSVFYKHKDSNFYPAMSYLLGQAMALIPQMLLDVLLFGTFVYWLVGFVASAVVSNSGSPRPHCREVVSPCTCFSPSHFYRATQGFVLYLVLFFSFNFTMHGLSMASRSLLEKTPSNGL